MIFRHSKLPTVLWSVAIGQFILMIFIKLTVAGEPIVPLPELEPLDQQKVELGRRLFNEPRLSGDGTVSCATCHDLPAGGDDGRKVSVGISGNLGDFNAPSVFNAAYNVSQFWNGRAATLEAQIDGPIHSEVEMGSTWPKIITILSSTADYVEMFDRAYNGKINATNIRNAIATYERSLVTPDAPFDLYLKGDKDAISAAAKAGYERFKEFGCAGCHQGMNVGGNMYQRLGVMDPDLNWYHGQDEDAHHLGRFSVTGRERDRHVFKVPSLRNVAVTAPYFHDGSVATLASAVEIMARLQLGRELSKDETSSIVAFLDTLTGTYLGQSLGSK